MKTKCSTSQHRAGTAAARSIPGMRSIAICVALAFGLASAGVAQAQSAGQSVLGQRAAPFWQSVTVPPAASRVDGARIPALQLKRFHGATLDLSGMKAMAASAPLEPADVATLAPTLVISLPHPDGSYQRFVLAESPIMEAGLAARHPEIKTYKGRGLDDPTATLRMDITPLGLHASVRSPNGGWFVDPYYMGDTSLYAAYGRADLVNPRGPLRENALNESQLSLSRGFYNEGDSVEVRGSGFAPGASVELAVRAEGAGAESLPLQSLRVSADAAGSFTLALPAGSAPGAYEISAGASGAAFHVVDAGVSAAAASGSQLRSYRLALVTDPSYASYFGGNPNNVTAAKVTLINRVTQIYEEETAIRLVLIDGTEALNLDTAAKMTGANGPCGAAACFTASQASTCGSGTLSRNRVVAGLLAGASNFDIGHIGLGLDGGGIASLGVVGGTSKAQGCTGIPTPVGDFYAVDYVAHEMGHQFAGNHTFNGVIGSCGGGNRNAGTSVEPGSGSSIMAYAGICGSDDLQTHSDPYWSQRSFDEITTYTSGAETILNEIQMGVLRGFTTDGLQFRIGYNGNLSVPIVRGGNYTIAGIKAAIEGIAGWPAGATVTASAVGDGAFTLTFGGSLAGVNLPTLALANPSGGASGYIGEITAGGPTTRRGAVAATGNTAPNVSVPAGYTIPVRTPFALTGSASDIDGDALTYLWEQNDRGAASGTGLVSNTKLNGPLFRQFGTRAVVVGSDTLQYDSPGENHVTGNPQRVFPDLRQILANNTNAETGACPAASATPTATQIECFSEFLPTAAYVGFAGVNAAPASLHFKLTARDGRGGVNSATTTLTLAPAAGPFLVTSFNSAGVSVDSGSTQTVTWNVANTNVAPVSTANVRIALSTDGGLSWPTVLAESVPNSGSASVTLPALATTSARIKVEAVDNVFFDVSNANFAIRLAGDVDGDGAVSCADVAIVKAALGKRSGQAGFDARADLNKDNTVDSRDLLYVNQRLPKGNSCI
jgi:hypothetical protein